MPGEGHASFELGAVILSRADLWEIAETCRHCSPAGLLGGEWEKGGGRATALIDSAQEGRAKRKSLLQ